MKRSGTCPKCQSRSVLRGHDGTQYLSLGGVFEYTAFICADCGFEERYMNAAVARDRVRRGQLEPVNPAPQGPFR